MTWDRSREYEIGLDRGVLYPQDGPAESWNGLISVVETPSDDSLQSRHIDGVKTSSRRRTGGFSGTIEAFTYPPSLDDHIFSRDRLKSFGLSYRVPTQTRYKIHLVYNVRFSPEGILRKQSETASFSWNFTTKPVSVPEAKASAHLIVDTDKAYSWTVSSLEDLLYGNESGAPRLPSPAEVFEVFEENSILRVIDNGDGTFTVDGPDSAIQMLDLTTFQIDWPSAIYIDASTYKISSL